MRRTRPGIYRTWKDAVRGLGPVILAGALLWAAAIAAAWAVLR